MGSPHTRTGWVWPLGIIGQAMTASTPQEVADGIAQLRTLDGERGLFYESVNPNDPSQFTRSDFGWANALYAELIFRSVAWLPPAAPTTPALPRLFGPDALTPRITTETQAWDAAATIYGSLGQILSGG